MLGKITSKRLSFTVDNNVVDVLHIIRIATVYAASILWVSLQSGPFGGRDLHEFRFHAFPQVH